jgi:hypothetical protein
VAISVGDILTLKSMKQFVPIAGQSGLCKHVEMIDMLDFGWERDKTYSADLFDEQSFVISSLMFARYDSNKLYATISRLFFANQNSSLGDADIFLDLLIPLTQYSVYNQRGSSPQETF